MLENNDLNLQTKFRVHVTSNIFKIIKMGLHRPPNSQLWKLTLPQGEVVGSIILHR